YEDRLRELQHQDSRDEGEDDDREARIVVGPIRHHHFAVRVLLLFGLFGRGWKDLGLFFVRHAVVGSGLYRSASILPGARLRVRLRIAGRAHRAGAAWARRIAPDGT